MHVLICPLKHATLLTHFSSCSIMFYSFAAEESSNLRPYLTVVYCLALVTL